MVTLSAKVITLATAFTALIPLPTFAAASLLRCQAKDAINLQDDGTLARDRMAEENGITVRTKSQPTFTTQSAHNGHS
jgi:hypothetical protein